MSKFLTAAGVLFGIAVWFLLFVILGTGLGTAFIAGGCVVAAGVIAAGMVFPRLRPVLDAPLTAPGLLLGIAAFAILEVVLSVTMWVGVITGLGVLGLYGVIDVALRRDLIGPRREEKKVAPTWQGNGHDRSEAQTVAAR